jgi:hypothetical protein
MRLRLFRFSTFSFARYNYFEPSRAFVFSSPYLKLFPRSYTPSDPNSKINGGTWGKTSEAAHVCTASRFHFLPPPTTNCALGMRSYIDESIARTRGIPGILRVLSFSVRVSCDVRPQRLWRAQISATRRRQVQHGSCKERY